MGWTKATRSQGAITLSITQACLKSQWLDGAKLSSSLWMTQQYLSWKTFTEAHQRLREIMEQAGGIFDWARKHNCEFGIEKFQLVDFSRQLIPNPINPRKKIPIGRPSLRLSTQVIKSQGYAKFLGVIVDNSLRWKEQNAAALAKGQDWVLQFGQLSKPTKGASRSNMRRLYLAVAVPRMLYAADVFLTPETHNRGNRTAQ